MDKAFVKIYQSPIIRPDDYWLVKVFSPITEETQEKRGPMSTSPLFEVCFSEELMSSIEEKGEWIILSRRDKGAEFRVEFNTAYEWVMLTENGYRVLWFTEYNRYKQMRLYIRAPTTRFDVEYHKKQVRMPKETIPVNFMSRARKVENKQHTMMKWVNSGSYM